MTVCDRVIVHLREITMGCEEPICPNRFWCIEDVCFTSRLSYPMVPKKKIRLLSIEPVLAKVEPCDFKYNLCVSRKLKKNVLYTYDDLKQNKQYYPQKPLFLKSEIRKTDDWKLFS